MPSWRSVRRTSRASPGTTEWSVVRGVGLGLLSQVEPAETMKGNPDTQNQRDYQVPEDGGAQRGQHRQRHERHPYTVQGSIHAAPV